MATAIPQPIATVEYERISQDREGRELGVTRQREDNDALCERNGWPVAARYRDNDRGASSRSKKPRPGYEQMLRDIESARFGPGPVRIVAYTTGRLTRRPAEYERLIDLADKGIITIVTVKSTNVDLTTASGRMVARVLAAMDAMEAEQAAERIERAAEQRRAQGRSHGGWTPFGYRSAGGGRLTVVEEEAECIREGARMILVGKKLMEVAHEWNRRGVTRLNGEPWTDPDQINHALSATRICGWTSHEGELVAKGQWEPIVDRETFEAVQAVLGQGRGRNPGGGRRKWVLSGHLYCGQCGHGMVVNGPRYICRDTQRGAGKACGSVTRSREWLEAAVQGYVFSAIANGHVPQGGADAAGTEDLSGRVKTLEAEIEKLMRAYRAEVFTLEEVGPLVATVRAQLAEARVQAQRAAAAKAADVGALGLELIDVWQDETPETLSQRREILARYVERIEVLPLGRGNRATAGSIRIIEPGGRVIEPSVPDFRGDPFMAWSAGPLESP